MKKQLSIFAAIVAVCIAATICVFAATADIVHQSVEGTAVIDGVKDEAYDGALALDFIQKGKNNGAGETLDEPIGTAYIINDAEWVYVYFDVLDSQLDSASANNYEQDSVEAFWMDGNAKNQIRYHVAQDENGEYIVDVDSGTAYASAVAITDTGYAVELQFPITDVKDNQIEMCLQINACSDGKRDYTCYIEGNADGDDAYQRADRESTYDVWWTLTLAGEHEDTRVEKIDEPLEITYDTYTELRDTTFGVQLISQDLITWSWVGVGEQQTGNLGDTLELNWTDTYLVMNWTEAETNNFTTDPKFVLQINDGGFLQLPEDAAIGDTGDTAKYTFSYTDITITAEGYEDVVVPGGRLDDIRFTVKQEDGWTSGTAAEISLVTDIKSQLGLDTEGLCEYLKNVTGVSTTVTFEMYRGRTKADLDAFMVTLDEEDQTELAALQEYVDRVEAAKTVIEDETTDLAAKQEALEDATQAANRANMTAKDYYTQTRAKADELLATVEELTQTVSEFEAEAAQAEAEKTEPENDSEEAKTAEPANEPAASNASDSGAPVVLIVVIAVVVVVVIVIIIVAASKKKKK